MRGLVLEKAPGVFSRIASLDLLPNSDTIAVSVVNVINKKYFKLV